MIDALREQLQAILPERAFLRRARGDATFVTDAPRHADVSLLPALEAAGFVGIVRGNCLEISPGAGFLTAFEELHPEPTGFFSASLLRLRGASPCPDALALFSVGLRLMEHATVGECRAFDRRARKLAAFCLRTHAGGAYACALIDETLKSPSTKGASL